jgi:signal transduction histidine kinase
MTATVDLDASGRTVEMHAQELRARIAWIIRLRWMAAAGVAATIWLVPQIFAISLDQRPLYLVTLGLAFYNLLLWSALHWIPQVERGLGLSLFANLQISLDLLFLAALLHLSGGVENPFAAYYVFHIVIAGILLSRRAAFGQMALALLIFVAMALAEFSGLLPHHHIAHYLGLDIYRNPTFLAATIFVMGTTLGFTAFMATSIVARLRQREAEIVTLSDSLGDRAAELQTAYDALRRLEREKSAYMQRAAHDLRSPMSAVDLLLAVVIEGRTGELSEKGLDLLQRARRKIDQIIDLSGDLLTLSRAREAAFEAAPRKLDLVETIAKVVEELSPRAEEASIALSVNTPEQPVPVMGDAASLTELVENLLSNAVKYTPEGGKVTLDLVAQGERAVLTVRDSGIGIPEVDREHVFEEFYRAPNARESGKEGTGLGLSIVKAIVDSHKGTISVESEPGEGTSFRVTLPIARPADGPSAAR